MSDPRAQPPAPKIELVTMWQSKAGLTMMSVVSDGKVCDYEIPRRLLAFLLQEAARELARE